jgi:hypothetical protein
VFDLAYLPYIVLLLSVFGAAAGALGAAVFGWQTLAGTLCLMVATVACVAFGNTSVERLFKWVSVLLYATYALFLLIAIAKFGNQAAPHFALPADSTGSASVRLHIERNKSTGLSSAVAASSGPLTHLRRECVALRAAFIRTLVPECPA